MRLRLLALFLTSLANAEPILDRYCAGCHNEKLKTAGLSIAAVDFHQDSAAAEKIIRRLRARQMPPPGLPRPDEATYQSLVTALEASVDKAALANPNPGRTDTFRRLNRNEYQNAIRDLLAIDVDVTPLLPADEASHGFDNITVGDLSPTLLERYLNAARKISRLAIGAPIKAPNGDTFTLPPDLTQEDHFDALPLGTRGGTSLRYTFPLDADYEIVLRLARDRNEHVEGLTEAHEVEILIDGERVQRFTVKPPKSGEDHHAVDLHLKLRTAVKAGPHQIAAAFVKKPTALLETERQPYPAHFNMDRHPRVQPAVYSVSVNGPYEARGPGDTPSRRKIFVCTTQDNKCAERIFSNLARRAYRRPVDASDLRAPMKFYTAARATAPFEEGIEMGLRAILVSPEFLFRVERDPDKLAAGAAYRVSDLELASRLSFFLWSSIPDEELLAAAESKTLHNAAVLDKQVRRMMRDPRSRALVNHFASQWLYLRNISSTLPDMRLFADFDDNLRQSFRKETELFVESILRDDRSILDLLRADYTFLNERLAKHYGIPNIYGSRFRRVQLDADSKRGGLLRQGSLLLVTSYPTRTSPVIRGKWVLDNLLGIPPPPPPPNIPALKDKAAIGKNLSMRERLAEHRANPACAGCHQLMDPIGFVFENYDAVGRWREREDSLPIDTAGALPDGTKFQSVADLQKALLQRPELLASTFTEKLLTFALGRGVEFYDEPAVRAITRKASTDDYRFSSFILGVVSSQPFQMRRSK
ncbi:DUF1592 domain-containing protein [Bryobacter aggregatus]|uniref:DUF1592 domain-containing protein n=1 Tax=Bryobacter aggregatus TaxID=360054 RepID=UPI001EE1CD76|nr:DUF1592 domain-containing protein [Bryobacter aggregatus]